MSGAIGMMNKSSVGFGCSYVVDYSRHNIMQCEIMTLLLNMNDSQRTGLRAHQLILQASDAIREEVLGTDQLEQEEA